MCKFGILMLGGSGKIWSESSHTSQVGQLAEIEVPLGNITWGRLSVWYVHEIRLT